MYCAGISIMLQNIIAAIISGVFAGIQESFYITPKSRNKCLLFISVYSLAVFLFISQSSILLINLCSLAFILITSVLSYFFFYGETFCLIYNNMIQTVVTIGAVYVASRLADSPLIYIGIVLVLNLTWCFIMGKLRYLVFIMMPYTEKTYKITFSICLTLYATEMFLINHDSILYGVPQKYLVPACALIFIIMELCLTLHRFIFTNSDLKQESQRACIEARNRIMQTYIDDYMKYSEKLEVINHDNKHFIRTLFEIMEQKDFDRATSILSEIVTMYDDAKNVSYCKDALINSIITDAEKKCTSSSIRFTPTVRLNEKILIDDLDITSIMMNILDNAFENCDVRDDGMEKYIDFSTYLVGGYLVIKCTNSVKTPPVIINNRIATTRECKVGHGIGLESINVSTKKYRGSVNLKTDDSSFTISVILENELSENI